MTINHAALETTYDLGPADRIPFGEGRAFHVAFQKIAVFRLRTGELYAVQAECPHAGGPLADGLVGGRQVVCPLHGRSFDLETGLELREQCAALRRYTVRASESGHILVVVPEEQP